LFLVALLVGLVMLVAGAELVVRGGGDLALWMRIPALVVGLTVVAFGTSAPELAVSVTAAFNASTDMALANVIGSNVANLALVLGLAALVRPLSVDSRLARREIPICLLLQLLVPVFALDGVVGRVDGLVLLLVGVGYNVWLVMEARQRRARLLDDDDEGPVGDGAWRKHVAILVAGIAIIVVGSWFFVGGATEIALRLGMSDRYVGLTVVALGTSAPEVATSVVSSWRDQGELAVGNAIGSNILNISLVLAATSFVTPIVLNDAGVFVDFAVAFGVTALLIPMVIRDRLLGRVEGGVLTVGYLAYVFLTPH